MQSCQERSVCVWRYLAHTSTQHTSLHTTHVKDECRATTPHHTSPAAKQENETKGKTPHARKLYLYQKLVWSTVKHAEKKRVNLTENKGACNGVRAQDSRVEEALTGLHHICVCVSLLQLVLHAEVRTKTRTMRTRSGQPPSPRVVWVCVSSSAVSSTVFGCLDPHPASHRFQERCCIWWSFFLLLY